MLTSLNWQKMTIICTVEKLSTCPYKIHKLGRMYATAAPDVHIFITGKCLWNGRALMNLFLCMQSWNAGFFLFFFLVGYSLWGGGGDFGSGSGSKFNCAGRVGSDNLGYGPGSGFSFEPVQTSTARACGLALPARAHTSLSLHLVSFCSVRGGDKQHVQLNTDIMLLLQFYIRDVTVWTFLITIIMTKIIMVFSIITVSLKCAGDVQKVPIDKSLQVLYSKI